MVSCSDVVGMHVETINSLTENLGRSIQVFVDFIGCSEPAVATGVQCHLKLREDDSEQMKWSWGYGCTERK